MPNWFSLSISCADYPWASLCIEDVVKNWMIYNFIWKIGKTTDLITKKSLKLTKFEPIFMANATGYGLFTGRIV